MLFKSGGLSTIFFAASRTSFSLALGTSAVCLDGGQVTSAHILCKQIHHQLTQKVRASNGWRGFTFDFRHFCFVGTTPRVRVNLTAYQFESARNFLPSKLEDTTLDKKFLWNKHVETIIGFQPAKSSKIEDQQNMQKHFCSAIINI